MTEKKEDKSMGRKMKKVVSLLGVFVMIFGMFSPLQDFFAAENTENVKTDASLLEIIEVSYEDLISGNFQESGELYSCIIWIEDIDMEIAAKNNYSVTGDGVKIGQIENYCPTKNSVTKPSGVGTYTITVKQTQAASDGSATLFGVAWR